MSPHTGDRGEFCVHGSCTGCGECPLQMNPNCCSSDHTGSLDVMPLCSWSQHMQSSVRDSAPPPLSTGASSLVKASFSCETQWSAPLESRSVFDWDFEYCTNPAAPVWFNQEIILNIECWYIKLSTFIYAGAQLKLPGTECSDPGVSLTITGWYRVGSFLAVASESFSNRIQGPAVFWFSIPSSPTCWKDTNMVCLSSVPVRICRFVGLTGYSELNTTECSKTYGWKYDDCLAGCLCSTADYMQMSVASLLFLCRIGSDCDLFLINWTAEWLDDKGSQHYSFSFF